MKTRTRTRPIDSEQLFEMMAAFGEDAGPIVNVITGERYDLRTGMATLEVPDESVELGYALDGGAFIFRTFENQREANEFMASREALYGADRVEFVQAMTSDEFKNATNAR